MLLRAASVAALLGVSLLLLQVPRASTPQVPAALPPAALSPAALSPAALSPATLSPPSASPAVLVGGAPSTVGPIPDGFRVRVPRLRIDLPIEEGIIERDIERQRTPEGFAFHLPGTAIPGERGNTYLYSHARAGMFLSLWDARPGDEILIATPDGRTLTYVVSEVRPRVAPNDVSVAQPTPEERLTLQTSTGPNAGDPRFVVIALPRQYW